MLRVNIVGLYDEHDKHNQGHALIHKIVYTVGLYGRSQFCFPTPTIGGAMKIGLYSFIVDSYLFNLKSPIHDLDPNLGVKLAKNNNLWALHENQHFHPSPSMIGVMNMHWTA